MTRRYHSAAAARQAEAEADDCADAAERIGHLIGLEEAPAEPKPAVFIAEINRMGRKLYLFRAACVIPCERCQRPISADGYFTSTFRTLEADVSCTRCRMFRWPRGVKR